MQSENTPVSKTKVVYLITKGGWGGAQKYVYNLAVLLPKDLYEVTVVCGQGNALKERLESKNIKVISVGSLKRDLSIVREIVSFFRLFWIIFREKPKVLHLNSPKAGGIGSVIGRILFVKKIIYTAHGWTFNEERPPLQNSLILIFSWLTAILCHKVIVIAKREQEQALNFPLINNNNIVLIRNGIENIEFLEKEKALEELGKKIGKIFEKDTLIIGTIAELHKNKGYEYALEAMRKIDKSFEYIIIGGGEERKNIEYLIKKYNLENKVHLVGFLEKANEYLKAFDIFLLTSVKEGLPYAITEAGLAGLPVIASNIGGIPDIIDNGKNGILITKARPGEISRSIEYLIDRPDERKLFGENLKQKIEKEFSVEKMMEEVIKLYN